MRINITREAWPEMIAFASSGKTLDAAPADRFARAPFFLLVEKGALREVVVNEEAEGASGVGGKVVQALLRKGVTAVVAPKYGPKAGDALKVAAITPWTGTRATVRELVEAFDAGTLTCAAEGTSPHA